MTTTIAKDTPLIIGHEWAVDLLNHSIATGHPSHAYLFTGPTGIGKTSLALYLARALNCLVENQRPCGHCSACRQIGAHLHPDVKVIDEPEDSIKIDQIRALQREMALSPFIGRWRVYILCNFEKATPEAANCLLKTLEEPPSKVILILTTPQTEMLLPTIVSRCQVLNLHPLPIDHVQQALQTYWGIEPHQAKLLARLSTGRIGWAIEASVNDTLLRQREKYLVALEQALRQDRTERMGLAQQLSQEPQRLSTVFNVWQSWWRDLMLAKSGNTHALTNIDREQTVCHEAQLYTLEQIGAYLHAIQHAAQQIEQNVNPRLALEVLLLKMPYPSDTSQE